MKIGIYDPYLDTLSGGERYMLTAASCLSNENKVDVFWNEPQVTPKAAEKFDLSLKNVQVVHNLFTANSSLVYKIKQTKQYDRILFLSDGSIPITAAKKTILHFQSPVESVKYSLKTKLKMRNIYAVVCNSQFTKSFIDRKFKCDSIVIYPPVQLLQPVPFSEKENVILTVGRYSKLTNGDDFKKLAFLIETFNTLEAKGLKNWKFIIVTNFLEKDKNDIKLLESLITSKNISIKTNVSKDGLKKLYASAKIYWHAAGYNEDQVKTPDRMEHFGISTVEAMSAGCIPIVINAGGQKEIVTDGKNGFLWNTQEELMEKTLRVANWKDSSVHVNNKDLEELFGEERFCRDMTTLMQ